MRAGGERRRAARHMVIACPHRPLPAERDTPLAVLTRSLVEVERGSHEREPSTSCHPGVLLLLLLHERCELREEGTVRAVRRRMARASLVGREGAAARGIATEQRVREEAGACGREELRAQGHSPKVDAAGPQVGGHDRLGEAARVERAAAPRAQHLRIRHVRGAEAVV